MNSSQRIAAGRYAAAYDALSRTNEEAVGRATELEQAALLLAAQAALLTNPCVALEQKKQVVRQVLAQEPHVVPFIEVLLEAKRYTLLPEIITQVAALTDKRLGIVRARVVSAQELSAGEKNRTQEVLSARYGGQVKAVFETDQKLLGGLKIWCNGELIDGSLQGQLARLQAVLMK